MALGNGELSVKSMVNVPPSDPAIAAKYPAHIVPGDPDKSFLMKKLIGPSPGEGVRMPMSGPPLDAATIEAIRTWIARMPQDAPVRNLILVAAIAGASIALAPTRCSSDPEPPAATDAGTQSQLIFRDPETCRPCHEQHVSDWAGSMHASAAKDPLFHGIADVMISDFVGEKAAEQFCTQCHTVPGTFLGETKLERGVGGSFVIKT